MHFTAFLSFIYPFELTNPLISKKDKSLIESGKLKNIKPGRLKTE